MQIKMTVGFHLTSVRMAKINNTSDSLCWRGCGAKGIVLQSWSECKLVQPRWKLIWWFLRKGRIVLSQDPAIPRLGIYPKDTCSNMFTEALFILARNREQLRFPSTEQ